jgi:hypothetical protein
MHELKPEALHVKRRSDTNYRGLSLPRRYTLTHSDMTGHLFLEIGKDFCQEQISNLYTRLMRDEVLAEWKQVEGIYQLHVNCHVSGGLVFGSSRMRFNIFRQHMRLVLEALRYGDRELYILHPELCQSTVLVHFRSKDTNFNLVQEYGRISEYA